jgi:hypothetical protein
MLTVPILWYILRLANDKSLMETPNTVFQNFWLGGAIGGTIAANVVFFWTLIR